MVEADSDEETMDMDVKPHKSSKGVVAFAFCRLN